jgi:bifunctional non-homologous end joining protein LigD
MGAAEHTRRAARGGSPTARHGAPVHHSGVRKDAADATRQLPLEFAATPPGNRLPERVAPMRPTDGDAPFDDPGYYFEPWWPGIRAFVFVEGGRVRLRAEALTDPTAAFPELAALPGLLARDGVVLDATLLVLDATTRPNTTFLNQRLDAPTNTTRLLGRAALVAQDLLYLDGRTMADRPFGERRAELAALMTPSAWCLPGRGFVGDGITVATALGEMGFRALSARRLDARVRPGPAGDAWYRVPVTPRQRDLPPFLAIFSKLPL